MRCDEFFVVEPRRHHASLDRKFCCRQGSRKGRHLCGQRAQIQHLRAGQFIAVEWVTDGLQLRAKNAQGKGCHTRTTQRTRRAQIEVLIGGTGIRGVKLGRYHLWRQRFTGDLTRPGLLDELTRIEIGRVSHGPGDKRIDQPRRVRISKIKAEMGDDDLTCKGLKKNHGRFRFVCHPLSIALFSRQPTR